MILNNKKKTQRRNSKLKVILMVIFNVRRIVYQEFLYEGQIVSGNLYVYVLKRLRNRVRRVGPNL